MYGLPQSTTKSFSPIQVKSKICRPSSKVNPVFLLEKENHLNRDQAEDDLHNLKKIKTNLIHQITLNSAVTNNGKLSFQASKMMPKNHITNLYTTVSILNLEIFSPVTGIIYILWYISPFVFQRSWKIQQVWKKHECEV